jgi:hypothetical protein
MVSYLGFRGSGSFRHLRWFDVSVQDPMLVNRSKCTKKGTKIDLHIAWKHDSKEFLVITSIPRSKDISHYSLGSPGACGMVR